MRLGIIVSVLLASGLASAAATETSPYAGMPYAGMKGRAIKSLSDQQIGDFKAGRGMGLALAAELNGYPGPSHVLELGEQLGLSPEQTSRTQDLLSRMKAEAVPLGEDVLRREAQLDKAFADRTATPDALRATLVDLGALQGELRFTHLNYHLAMLTILTPQQVERYQHLRGYGGGQHALPPGHGAHQP